MTSASTVFGKFRLLRALPSSELVETHQASLAGPGGFERTCLLRKLTPAGVRAGLTDAFAERARVAAALNHPNIARAFDFGKIGEEYYVAVDFTDGLSLDALLAHARERRHPPGPELAVHLGLRIADALAYAEAVPGVAPGALYPSLSPSGVVIGFDSLDVKLTHVGELEPPGSRALAVYSAPELEAGGPPDPRTAVYSAGAILYELATGQKPRAVGEPPAIPTLGALVPGFPQDVELVVLRALVPDPSKRFATARELLAALEGLRATHGWRDGKNRLAALLTEAAPEWRDRRDPLDPNTEPAVPAPSGTPRWLFAALGAVAAVLAVAALFVSGALESKPPPAPVAAPREPSPEQKEARAHQVAGLAAEERGDYEMAVRELEKAAALDPASAIELLAIARDLRDRARGPDAGVTPPPRSAPAAAPAPPAAPTSPAPGP